MQAFKNITVLDMSQGIAGPVCAAILARQGARVIKVEPLGGDWMRGTGAAKEGMPSNVVVGNINKQSIALDVSKPAGREALLRLAQQADVLVENFRPGVMRRLGLDYDTVKALNARIVYCSVTGFGPQGPLSGKAATDSVVQAHTGMAVANGIESPPNALGQPPHFTPKRIGIYVPDNISAIYAAQAISAALFERANTGAGQHLDISLMQCCAAFQAGPMVDSFLFPDTGMRSAVIAPAGDFQSSDGWMIVSCLNDEMFQRLAKAVGREEWLRDERFVKNEARKRNSKEINAALGEVIATNTAAHWVRCLEAADVLVSAVNNYATLRDDPQMQAMQYFGELEQEPYGKVTVPHLPGSDSELRAAPRLGEHTREILHACGLSPAEVEALISQGIAVQRPIT